MGAAGTARSSAVVRVTRAHARTLSLHADESNPSQTQLLRAAPSTYALALQPRAHAPPPAIPCSLADRALGGSDEFPPEDNLDTVTN